MDNTDALLGAFDAQARAEPPDPPPGVWHEHDGQVLRVVGQERGFISAPRDTGARGADLDRLIARQRDYFAARGEAVEWKTYGYDEPADLPGRLRAAGFVPEDTETVVVALTTAIAAEPVLPEGVALRQVTADADMRRIAAMESEVWSLDRAWTGDHLIRQVAATPDDYIVLTAEAAGKVVAAGWLEMHPGSLFAGLWGGATLAEWRGRGIYRALVARRAQLAAGRGVRYLRSTPPATAPRSSSALASSLSLRRHRTSGPRPADMKAQPRYGCRAAGLHYQSRGSGGSAPGLAARN